MLSVVQLSDISLVQGRCGMRGGTCGDAGAASPGEVVVDTRPGEVEDEVVPTTGPSE